MLILSYQLTEIKKCINNYYLNRKHSEFKHIKEYDNKIYKCKHIIIIYSNRQFTLEYLYNAC